MGKLYNQPLYIGGITILNACKLRSYRKISVLEMESNKEANGAWLLGEIGEKPKQLVLRFQ